MNRFIPDRDLLPDDVARRQFRLAQLSRRAEASGGSSQVEISPVTVPEYTAATVNQSESWLDRFNPSHAQRIRLAVRLLKRFLAPIRGRSDQYRAIQDRMLVAQSGLFDAEAYVRVWPEAGAVGRDPILHFLFEGWRTGANPGPYFDVGYYLHVNEDVRKSGQNPLVHYLRHGKGEGRLPLPPEKSVTGEDCFPLRKPAVPSPEDWERLSAAWQSPRALPVVDVVVPVYGGFDEVTNSLYAVLASCNKTPYQLIIIDDSSPQIELRLALQRLARRFSIELHRTPTNIGFVGACNFGMKLHPARDVILLNSDTEVYGDWIDRLRSAAYRHERTGTVTPLSNNAEISSYPRFVHNNQRELELADRVLDEVAARVNADREVEIPTGVGFCMYLRRDCLEDVGLFDMASFGRGYGEENDLCRRAAAAGWRNILAPNVFVRHFGGASFGNSKALRMRTALQTVERRHPGYTSLVGAFIKEDPVRPYREALDEARIRRHAHNRAMLFITHRVGGGTERHIVELSRLLEDHDTPVFFCRPDPHSPASIKIEHPNMGATPNLPKFDSRRDVGRFAEFLHAAGIVHIHIHHLAGFAENLAGFAENMADFIRNVCAVSGIRYDMTLHDYMAICPRLNLVDGSGLYCGEPELRSCEECITRDGSPFGRPSVWEWRDRYARLLAGARLIFVPDDDVKHRIHRYFSNVTIAVRPHPEMPREESKASRLPATRVPKGSKRRVIVLGAIGVAKGSKLLQDTAAAAAELGLPLEFVVIGYTDRDRDLKQIGNVTVTGKYAEGEESGMLTSVEADLAWFPTVCPETYSYTLSAVFTAGLFPVAFDFGAIATRIRAARWGELVPLNHMLDPELLARFLMEIHVPRPVPGEPRLRIRTYPVPLQSYYALDDGSPDPTAARFAAQ